MRSALLLLFAFLYLCSAGLIIVENPCPGCNGWITDRYGDIECINCYGDMLFLGKKGEALTNSEADLDFIDNSAN